MTDQIATTGLIVLGVIWLVSTVGFALVSWREGERRATRVAILLAAGGSMLFIIAASLPVGVRLAGLVGLGLVGIAGLVVFFLPIGQIDMTQTTPHRRVDEREIMFARGLLVPGSPEYESYYQMHPEHKKGDDLTRSKPGLLSFGSKYFNPLLYASSEGSFFMTGALREAIDGPVYEHPYDFDAQSMSDFVKNLAKFYGALDAGIAELLPYHVYSHVGRGSGKYGEPIQVEHKYAIAFTVEMDFEMIGANPGAPGVVESTRQYVEAARVAVPLAAAIRYWGYPARAHIDGNYRVIAPLVARDAGLGEIGRMGLLMTPRQGPRIRVGAVTTDLPLIPDAPTRNGSTIDFCTICKKCAEACPSKSIPFDDRREIDGAWRWRINADTCFRYWSVAGTDCGRCMTVCPYAHPDSFSHNLVRWGVARSGAFRRVGLALDDLFYGKVPAPRQAPAWTRGAVEMIKIDDDKPSSAVNNQTKVGANSIFSNERIE
jgi:ferredoxin